MREILKSTRKNLFLWIFASVFVLMCCGVFAGNAWAGNGFINVVTEPEGAKVTVDTDEEGITPCKLEVPEGTRRLKIKLRAYIGANKSVEVKAGETVDIEVKLVAIPTT